MGHIEKPDGLGEYVSDICGDMIRFYLTVSKDRISDVKFQCFGCVGSIACGSALTEIVLGKEIKIAISVTERDVLEALGGLTEDKSHCATLAIGAFKRAIESYTNVSYGGSI